MNIKSGILSVFVTWRSYGYCTGIIHIKMHERAIKQQICINPLRSIRSNNVFTCGTVNVYNLDLQRNQIPCPAFLRFITFYTTFARNYMIHFPFIFQQFRRTCLRLIYDHLLNMK